MVNVRLGMGGAEISGVARDGQVKGRLYALLPSMLTRK